ncbi:myosin-11-like [Larimichthys crocea]|uniref:myosin-11-like n=1 Tax=Larimichthys crocea TaxID=215358 RepID=UPI000F5FE170|nr:myosin-11-like [Larimichthys crocea]
MEKLGAKHFNMDLSANTMKQEASLSEIETLKNELQEMQRKHSSEKQMLVTKLSEAKQELEDLNRELKTEKHLRMQVENEKLEAVEIAETLFQRLEDMQSVSDLKSEKTKQDQLHQEILDLQQMLQTEQTLREEAEAENLKDFEMLEAACTEFDEQLQKESKLREEAEIGKMEAVEIAETLLQRLEDMQSVSDLKSEKTKQDQLHHEILELQQTLQTVQALREEAEAENLKDVEMLAVCTEFDGQLQKESKLREEAEIGKMEAVEIAETLLPRVEELSAKSQTFTHELKKKEGKKKALVGDIMELTRMLDEEMVKALQKRIRWRSSAKMRASCCNRKCFSLRFSSRRRIRASHWGPISQV